MRVKTSLNVPEKGLMSKYWDLRVVFPVDLCSRGFSLRMRKQTVNLWELDTIGTSAGKIGLTVCKSTSSS